MYQVLDGDKSLSNGVNRVIAWIAAARENVPSADTGGCSKARKRLALAVLKSLLPRTAVYPYVPGETRALVVWATGESL